MNNIKWDLSDITLMPAEISDIYSRRQCDTSLRFITPHSIIIYFSLPLMSSPMDTVTSKDNYKKYRKNGIIPCLSRGTYIDCDYEYPHFQAFGLCEIEKSLHELRNDERNSRSYDETFYNHKNVLIDIANAHMSNLIYLIKEIKEKWPKMILMIGNVGNPETFINLALAGADFVRVGIGVGAGCTTSANVSVNYPMGSLISECYELRKHYDINTKIVADGGVKNYSDVIKSLALGADFVMCGSIFNKAIESAGFNYLWKIKISYKLAEILWRWGFPIKKKYRGMSTKAVQRSWGKSKLVTAEGITKYQKVEYTLEQWTENFKDYLKSAMSYCNAKTLDDFIGKAKYVFITENALKRFQK